MENEHLENCMHFKEAWGVDSDGSGGHHFFLSIFSGASSYMAIDCWTLSIQIKKKGVLLNVNFGAFYNDY